MSAFPVDDFIRVDAIAKELRTIDFIKSSADQAAALARLRDLGGDAPLPLALKSGLDLPGLAFKIASPLLGVAVGFLSAKAMDLIGMHQTTLADLNRALMVVESLQRETLDLVKETQIAMQSAAAVQAETNLKFYLAEMKSLAYYEQPNASDEERQKITEAYNTKREAIVKAINDNFIRDRRAIHSALVGEQSDLGLDRSGILHYVYKKLSDKLHSDTSFTMQQMAKALDQHFLSALFMQWHYFNLWTSVNFTDQITVRAQLTDFLDNLQTQVKKFKALQPAALDYFVRDADALGSTRTYHLRHHDHPTHTMWGLDNVTHDHTSLSLQTAEEIESMKGRGAWDRLTKGAYFGGDNRWWLRDRDLANGKPPHTMLSEISGSENTTVSLETPLAYHGSGFVSLHKERGEGWPTWYSLTKSWTIDPSFRPPRSEQLVTSAPSFKLLPIKEGGQNADKVLVSLWETEWNHYFQVGPVDRVFEVVSV